MVREGITARLVCDGVMSMIFLYLVEFFVTLLVFLFFLFQIIIPIWNGTMLFPSFRYKARELERQMREARSDLELSEQEKKLKELKERN